MKVPGWIKTAWYFLEFFYGGVRSVYICTFRSIRHPAIFYGWGAARFASGFAKKRGRRWKRHWDQSGKQQGVIPFTQSHLFVGSKAEIKDMQKKKAFPAGVNARKVIQKYSLFKTSL